MGQAVTLAIQGASGRMGRQLVTLAADDPAFGEVRALNSGNDLSKLDRPDVMVDFSSPQGFADALNYCRKQGVPLVSGTTGLGTEGEQAIVAASNDIAILHAANFSLGIAVLTQLLARAAKSLPDWHLEIMEAHHAGKRDAPSGTALALGRAAASARGQDFDRVRHSGRDGHGEPRAATEIGFASLRAGDIAGEHTALLAGANERIELTHRATDRAIFARGALTAAAWLAGREPGCYALADLLPEQA